MTTKKSYDEVMAEREKHPLGTPRPYTPDHPNLLLMEPARPSANSGPLLTLPWRIGAVLFAMLLIGHGAHGVFTDDLWLPGTRRSPGSHHHGVSAVFFFMMLASWAAWLIMSAFVRYDPLRKQPSNNWLGRLLLATSMFWMVAGFYTS